MKALVNGALALGLAGALTVATAETSEARWRAGPVVAGAAIGLAAGAVIGSALTSRSYSPGYGYYGGYAYEPAYSYSYPAYGYGYVEPAPVYAEPVYPAPVYAAPAPTYGYAATTTYVAPAYVAPRAGRCWVATDPDKGLGYWRGC